MKCSFCGADMLPSDKFCNNCGASNPNAANNGAPSRIPGPSDGNGQYGQKDDLSAFGNGVLGKTRSLLFAQPAAAEDTCPNCGAPIKPGTHFCTKCGHKID